MKTVLITGSTSGIGKETAKQLARMGWSVWISGRNAAKLKEVQGEFASMGLDVLTLEMDVSNPESINTAADIFGRSRQNLDVLINNAAILLPEDKSIQQASEIQEKVFRTNVWGVQDVIATFLHFIPSGGRIIQISSSGGSMHDAVGGWSPVYCMSKTLLNALTRQWNAHLESRNISVYSVDPGWVKTKMGGMSAPRQVEQGAETPVWLASNLETIPGGKFYRDKQEIPW